MRLVDADALTKELAEDMKYDCSYYHDWTQKETRDAKYSFAIDRIASAPTIDAVPVVHGRWESIHKYNDGERAVGTCSVCKATGELRTKRDEWCCWAIDSPYCPNCGAKMDGEAK